jgi:hypothetical protein
VSGELRPPLWSSVQRSWLQIRRPGFDSRHYQKKKVVDLERGPLILVSTTEELLDRKISAPVQKTENTAVGIRHAHHMAPSIRKSWQSLHRQAVVAWSVGRYSSLVDSDLGVFACFCGELHVLASFSRGNCPWYQLHRRLGGHHGWCGHSGVERHHLHQPSRK